MAAEHSDAFVFFGATGDLAFKQIFPALLSLVRAEGFDLPIIGVARSGDLDALRERARQSLAAAGVADSAAVRRLLAGLRYVRGSDDDIETFRALRRELGAAARPLHYLAVPPALFGEVVANLAASGCAAGARVILEKPFGRDLASAVALNATVHRVLDEPAIFRIDHYLGKEPVQNLLYFRFANSFLEPLWNRDHVASIQVNMPETFDVADRGAFYDQAGAIRDVVQNHLLQVVSLLAMEPPSGHTSEAVRDGQFKVLDSIRPLGPGDVVRGQYRGYRDVPGVAPGSTVETFAALRLHVDTWRWGGVPFYIRTGKCLPVTATEVLVELEAPAPRGVRGAPAARLRPLPLPALAGHVDLARRARQEARRGDGRRGRGALRVPPERDGAPAVPAPDRRRDARRPVPVRARGFGRGGLAGRGRDPGRPDTHPRVRARHLGSRRGVCDPRAGRPLARPGHRDRGPVRRGARGAPATGERAMTADDPLHAPGAPGAPPTWSSSEKDAVGTSHFSSRVWFTVGHGILNEIYWPRVDRPQVRDLGFIVADDARVLERGEAGCRAGGASPRAGRPRHRGGPPPPALHPDPAHLRGRPRGRRAHRGPTSRTRATRLTPTA